MSVFTETRPNKIPKKFKGADKCFYFRCWYTDIYGNRKRKQGEYYLREKYAKEAEIEFLNSLKDLTELNKITLGELKIDYLRHQKEEIKPTSLETLEDRLEHIKIIENIVAEEFNLKQFENWKSIINSLEIATSTKNNIYKSLRAMLNYGNKKYDLNIKIINKMTNFKNPSELKKEMLFYTKEEFNLFINNETDLKWICFFTTLFYCGLRQGEALALNWNDIDFEKCTIKINKSLSNKKKRENYQLMPPKTKGSNRTIPIPLNLLKRLKMLFNEQKRYTNFNMEWFIFGNIFPLPTTTIQARRDKLTKLSGLKRIRIHDFRHSCASLLISKGANITLVARYLGHDNVSTTLNTYSHFYKNDLSNLISNIDND